MNKQTGLYIHIPYCQNRCVYCDFYKEKGEAIENDYVDFLLKEAQFYKEEKKIEVDTLYFGGGTPSLLTVNQFEKLLTKLSETFAFSQNCEITIETNPENIDQIKFNDFKNLGLNRLSIGIQNLDDKILELLSRKVSSKEILKNLEIISKIGFEHLSFDLIVGAPFSKKERLIEDLKTLVKFPFCHASLYMLEIHEETKLYEMVKEGLPLLDDEEIIDHFRSAAEFLLENNFNHYEISNFSKNGCECKHNLKYWKREDYIGLGPSSHSYFRGFRTKNPDSIDLWKNYLSKGEFPAEEIIKEEGIEKIENQIIFGLRLKEGIELCIIEEYYKEVESDYSKLAKLFETGLLVADGSRVFLSEEGFLVSNEVIKFILSDYFKWK